MAFVVAACNLMGEIASPQRMRRTSSGGGGALVPRMALIISARVTLSFACAPPLPMEAFVRMTGYVLLRFFTFAPPGWAAHCLCICAIYSVHNLTGLRKPADICLALLLCPIAVRERRSWLRDLVLWRNIFERPRVSGRGEGIMAAPWSPQPEVSV